MEELENRVLFDAVIDAGCAFDCPADETITAPVDTQEVGKAQVVTQRQLVIIDEDVRDQGQLLSQIMAQSDSGVEVRFLTSSNGRNGIEQIADMLSGENAQYSAVHILSHGEAGKVQLGGEWLDADDLRESANVVSDWQNGLSEHADILFYGCDLASNESGLEFIATLSGLTSSDVAGSDDLTGSKLLGGDWDLEVSVGVVETASLVFDGYLNTLGPGEILGTVNDVTADSPVGVAGVTVTVFDDDNSVVGSATTDANGNYVIGGLTDGASFRVVFSNVPEGFESASVDQFESGSVVFATAGTSTTDFNIHRPLDYCESNPDLAVACYVAGTHDGLASDLAAIVSVEHDFNINSPKHVLATIGQVGSTYGMAHQSSSDTIFSSAFLKRNTGMGPEGMDAIYLIDSVNGGYANSSDSSLPIAIHLSDFGIDVGTELSSTDRGLTNDPNILVLDQWGWDNQFRLGIGDIDLSDDGNTLYVMNLNDHDGNGTHGQLVILDVSDLSNVSLKGTVDIPNLIPGVNDTDVRAFATKFEDGNLYIGVTATAESTQDRGDLAAAVYQLDANETTFSLVSIDSAHVYGDGTGPTDYIPLDYDRGAAYELGTDFQSADFQPWTNDASLYSDSSGFLSRPQPLMTDIEFDVDGSMILAFANRDAYQLGDFDIYPGGGSDTRPGLVAGELLRVANTATGFELEGGTAAPSNAVGADNLGPNGGEYYHRENLFSLHEESVMGSLALLPGSGQVVSTMMDPLRTHTGGLSRFSNSTGGNRQDIELYSLTDLGSAAKGAGLGDLEVICRAAPVEIGNYIWFDSDGDGIQDAGESALGNVLVGLWDDNGDLIATVETDQNGRYLFSSAEGTNINLDGDGLDEMAYGLDICSEDCTYTVGVLDSNFETGGALEEFELTVSNMLGTSNDASDHSDSDAVEISVGNSAMTASQGVTLTTGGAGVNNHTFDFGFVLVTEVPVVQPPVDIPTQPPVAPPEPFICNPVCTNDPIDIVIPPFTLQPQLPIKGGCQIDTCWEVFCVDVEPCCEVETCEVVESCEWTEPCDETEICEIVEMGECEVHEGSEWDTAEIIEPPLHEPFAEIDGETVLEETDFVSPIGGDFDSEIRAANESGLPGYFGLESPSYPAPWAESFKQSILMREKISPASRD